MKGKTLVDKLAQHFDEDWSTQRSTLRQSLEEQERSRYNPINSWDGKSDNPKTFSRLDHTVETAVQISRPIALSGCAVIPLEEPEGMSIFNAQKANNSSIKIPLTLEQREIGMAGENLKGEIPLKNNVTNNNQSLVMDKGPEFRNMVLNPPSYKVVEKPDYYVDRTSKTDKKILNPHERKNLMEFEIKNRAASRCSKKAGTDRLHTKEIIGGPAYHRGVLGIDSSDNINSEIYGERAIKSSEKTSRKENALDKKRNHLAEKGSSMCTKGNIIVPNSINNNIKENSLFQKKGGENHSLTYDETKNRIFKKNEITFDPIRGQQIRDQDLAGKNYNIVSHTAIEQWPSKVPPRENKVLDHPSQIALNHHRNLQGALNSRKYY
mmetsp:Transcript_28417/g.28724  ORF Transcript_28417/g.28724 Transcript_28417/m.28724 type:complete len:379 (-) Transcript_28417:127-1263(-)